MGFYEDLAPEREEVAYFMRRLYNKGLTTCSGGNLSRRGPDGMVLITPSSLDKGELTPDQVLVMTMDGRNLTPKFKPTIEQDIHLSIIRQRKDVNAVVHAHPPFGTTFASMDMDIVTHMTNETYLIVGKVAQANFAAPGTGDLAKLVAESLATANVSLMRNHGVISVGATMLKAFDLMEVTELAAKMTFIAKSLGACRPLNEGEIACMREAGLC